MNKLQTEIKRCEELLAIYKSIPEGFFGATIIEMSLRKAKEAKTEKEIKVALKDLQEIEG